MAGDLSQQRADFLLAHPAALQLIVEIDGQQHAETQQSDARRDGLLRHCGFDVLRIPAAHVRAGRGAALDQLAQAVATIECGMPLDSRGTCVMLCRRAHQLQVALCHALMRGLVPIGPKCQQVVQVHIQPTSDDAYVDDFVDLVLEDLNGLIGDLAKLYGEDDRKVHFTRGTGEGTLVIDFLAQFKTTRSPNTLFIKDVYVPCSLSIEAGSPPPAMANAQPEEAVCTRLLERLFGFKQFRAGQFEAVRRCVSGDDAIVLLPTGAGKSVAFQLASLLRPGPCIVIAPINSLIEDQIDNLLACGVDRVAHVTSDFGWKERESILADLGRSEYLFFYVSPERFQVLSFRESLRTLTVNTPVSLIAIDEAHCVSEWGHDFRPAYLNLARISREYCAKDGIPPPLMALTGTASRPVLKDVQRELEIPDFDAIITPLSFDRSELQFRIVPCRSSEKLARLRGVLDWLPFFFGQSRSEFFSLRGTDTHSGMVFCVHANGEFGAAGIAPKISAYLGVRVGTVTSTPPKGVDQKQWNRIRREAAQEFKRKSAGDGGLYQWLRNGH